MGRGLGALAIVCAVASAAIAAAGADQPVGVKITQRYLVPVCLDGAPVKGDTRSWRLAVAEHTLAFTMKNAPRHPMPAAPPSPGVAVIKFTPEIGHKYEVEVRAPETTFSTRIWERGQWSPVVRDRTTDRVVNAEPVWTDAGCKP